MRFLFILSFVFIQNLLSFQLFSQADSSNVKNKIKNISFALDFYQGKMIKIYSKSPIVDHSNYFSFNVLWQTDGSQRWHHSYSLPDIGLNVFYNYLGNDSILGLSFGICPNMMIKIRGQKRWGAFFKFASGFAYFNKPYNQVSNPENLVIGSHFTNMTNLSFNAFLKLNHHFSINGGYSLFHFSSGHIGIPNYGYNDLAWNIGIRYNPKAFVFNQCIKDNSNIQNNFIFNARVGIGYHQFSGTVSPSGGPLYPIYIIAPYISKKIGAVNNFRIGLSAKYFTSYHDFMLSENCFPGKESIYSWVGSIFVGDEWQIGRVGFLIEPSLKLYNPFFQKLYVEEHYEHLESAELKRWISLKSGLAYYLLKSANNQKYNPSIGLYINTNKTQADYVDISFSCGF